MLTLGAIQIVECPICNCENHLAEIGKPSLYLDDEILIIVHNIVCDNCESRFSVTKRMALDLLDANISCDLESHESHFGEGKYK